MAFVNSTFYIHILWSETKNYFCRCFHYRMSLGTKISNMSCCSDIQTYYDIINEIQSYAEDLLLDHQLTTTLLELGRPLHLCISYIMLRPSSILSFYKKSCLISFSLSLSNTINSFYYHIMSVYDYLMFFISYNYTRYM